MRICFDMDGVIEVSGGGYVQSVSVFIHYFIFYFFDGNQSLSVERIMRKKVIFCLVGWYLILLFFLQFQRHSFRRYSYFFALNSDGFDGVAETDNLFFHFLRLCWFFGYYSFDEGFSGVELNIGQFTDIQKGQFFFH